MFDVKGLVRGIMRRERTPRGDIFWAWFGGCLAILCVALLDRHIGRDCGLPMIIGSFGSSAVLLFASPELPAAQPRSLLLGHFLSAVIGVGCRMLLFDADPSLAAAVAVGTAIAAMCAAGALHPPGGATALIAVLGGPHIHQLGWGFVLVPCMLGAGVMLLVALATNNLCAGRPYPQRWF